VKREVFNLSLNLRALLHRNYRGRGGKKWGKEEKKEEEVYKGRLMKEERRANLTLPEPKKEEKRGK